MNGTPRRPTLDDVAAAAGVSRATVSNAYNRPDQLSAQLRDTVLRTAARLGYAGPNPVARSLATRRSGAIAVLLDENLSTAFSDPALSLTLDALASTMTDGRGLLLIPGGPAAHTQVVAAQAGVVVTYSLPDKAPVLKAVRDRRLPIVAIDGPAARGTLLVGVDDRGGAALAARHLIELGHRRIAILTTPDVTNSPGGPVTDQQATGSPYRVDRERIRGYLDVVDRAGNTCHIWESAGLARHDAAATAELVLAERPRPTAVLCMSDELAAGTLDAANRLGIHVPDALSVVGFDDTGTARHTRPGLTTVRQDLTAKGELAGHLAAQLLDGRRPKQPPPLTTELVVRASTSAPR